MRSTRPLLGTALAALLGAGALTGCGVSDVDLQPGVAATIGDEQISVQQVDDLSDPFCSVVTLLNKSNAQTDPTQASSAVRGDQLRNVVLSQLVLKAMTDQIAEENGIDGEAALGKAEKQQLLQLGGITTPDLEDALPLFAAQPYAQDVVSQVVGTSVTDDQQAAGAQALDYVQGWIADHGLSVNPMFDQIDFADATKATRQELSVAVSKEAVKAMQGTQDQADITALPSTQRCG